MDISEKTLQDVSVAENATSLTCKQCLIQVDTRSKQDTNNTKSFLLNKIYDSTKFSSIEKCCLVSVSIFLIFATEVG